MINTLSAITDDPEAQQIAQQLRDTEGRLVDHYTGSRGLTEDHVRHMFTLISRRFMDARVRTFLPILIERAVRRELER